MKLLDIAFKDLLRSLRNAFLIVMMFVAPLLLTGLLYFAFGRSGSGGFELMATRVQVANMDQAETSVGLAAGQMLADYLQGPELAGLLQVASAAGDAGARAAVERQEADVAVLIPAAFTVAAMVPDVTAAVVLYHDPTLTIQANIVRLVVGEYLDAFSGVKIAIQVTAQALAADSWVLDPATIAQIEQEYVAWAQSAGHAHGDGTPQQPILTSRTPAGDAAPQGLISTLLGPVMAGMMIFFAFFTGAAGAATLLHEQEEGTLARLFTTPTPRAAIMGGKFLAIVLTLAVQVTVLVAAGRLLFGIRWGQPATVALLVVGLTVAAAGFGVFLMLFVKATRQLGPVMGLTVSLTGMLGGLIPTGDPSQPGVFDKISLILPHGWAMHGWRLAVNGATPAEICLPVAVMLAFGAVLFVIGVLAFQRRCA
jgi:linearmycin/streptolysin S transport system permease protein